MKMCIRDRLNRLRKYMPVARSHMGNVSKAVLHWTKEVQYEPVFRLGSNMTVSYTHLL